MNRQYIDDLYKEIQAVELFTIEGEAVFMEDMKTQYAVIRCY